MATVLPTSTSPTMKTVGAWIGDTSHLDVSDIDGNVDARCKQICVGILKFFVSTPKGRIYGAQVGERLKLTDINVWGEGAACIAQTIVKITVEKGTPCTLHVSHGQIRYE